MKTDWTSHKDMELVLKLLTPENRLVVETMLVTGLRVSDVLNLTSFQLFEGLQEDGSAEITVIEQKTKKQRTIILPASLCNKLKNRMIGGLQAPETGAWLFPGRRTDKPRTRQAVWKDVKRAAKALRISLNLAPHSARKIYAVDLYHEQGLEAAMRALNHSDQATTLIYILSDLFSQEKLEKRRGGGAPKRTEQAQALKGQNAPTRAKRSGERAGAPPARPGGRPSPGAEKGANHRGATVA